MNKLIVKKLNKNDFQDTAELYQSIIENTFSKTFSKEAIHKYKEDWKEKNIGEAASDREKIMLVAKNNGKIVGLLFGSSINGGIGTIIWLAVSSGHRGRGIGKLLCIRAEAEYHKMGAHKIILYTETESAKNFYQKIGYSVEGIHPDHWWRVNHYCLTKIL